LFLTCSSAYFVSQDIINELLVYNVISQSTVCKNIIEKLGQTNLDETRRQVVSISQDSFYRELNAVEKIKASKGQFNFDHPGIAKINY